MVVIEDDVLPLAICFGGFDVGFEGGLRMSRLVERARHGFLPGGVLALKLANHPVAFGARRQLGPVILEILHHPCGLAEIVQNPLLPIAPPTVRSSHHSPSSRASEADCQPIWLRASGISFTLSPRLILTKILAI